MASKFVLLGAGYVKGLSGFRSACDTLNMESQSEPSS
jgi:hypothetical protein